jgi:hypothetical protein
MEPELYQEICELGQWTGVGLVEFKEKHLVFQFGWHCKNCGEVILPEEKELPVESLQSIRNS